jgi:hypothetical protein
MTGASHLSPYLGSRMQAVEIRGKPVFVRELLPQDLKIEINALVRREAAHVAGYLAAVVGEAHGRQMQRDERREWYRELRRNRAKALNALRGFGGALSISSWGISAAILSIAVQCQPSLETWVPCRCFTLVPHLLGGLILAQPDVNRVPQQIVGRPG